MVNNAAVMPINSLDLSTAQVDAVFAALAHSTRRSILMQLRRGSATVSELAAQFTISPPAISKHLRVLERAGLLVQKKEGRVRHCYLVVDPLVDACEWLEQYRQFWEESFDALDEFLATPEK